MHTSAQTNAVTNNSDTEQVFLNSLSQMYQEGFTAFKADFTEKPDMRHLFKAHTKLADKVLLAIWEHCEMDDAYSLVAVGGYGRAELFPYSDLDIMILVPDGQQPPQAKLEKLIGLFWDVGLNVGHSVRTIQECVIEAASDITTQTNMIECRLLTGDKALFNDYLSAITMHFDFADFFAGKIAEQSVRYAKNNDTAYNLEPNIKESPGGLRDMHTVMWLTRALLIQKAKDQQSTEITTIYKKGLNHLWTWLINEQIISPSENRELVKHEKNLKLLRAQLHFTAKRTEDRLLFDFQNEMASDLGYETTPSKRASEQLMQRYYRSVKFIQVMNEILIKSLTQVSSNETPKIEPLSEDFELRNGLLEAKSASLLQDRPTAIFEAFSALRQADKVKGFSANLLRNIQRSKKLINSAFRKNDVHKAQFIEILTQKNGVHTALRAMNRYGVLANYIPAFGNITGQMQHDLFHVYTVDEHILNVLGNLRRFAKPELAHEFPLCTELLAAFDKPHLLYLGALFHDIAKGRNGDHSALGKVDAAVFCREHNLPEEDGDLVAWLVDSHLKMSSTAQKSDLSDPTVIEGFAKFVKNERRLVALYLLTVADVRGTSPKVWNAWKARLFESLYYYTKNALEDDAQYTTNAIEARRTEASEKLVALGLRHSSYNRLWQQFGENYFVRYESDEIAWHSRLLTPHLHAEEPIVRARLSPNGDGIQVMIYLEEQKDLFARMCNFFDRMGYTIAEAKIYTTGHDYALDTFIILDSAGKAVSYTGLINYIETELFEKLNSNETLEMPIEGRVDRQIKHMPYETTVNIIEVADEHHQLEVLASDKPGLLARIAQVFIKHEIDVYNAKINTMGNRAEDMFLISGPNDQKLSDKVLRNLKQEIMDNI